MTQLRHYLAIDLGAESGRVISGSVSDERLALTEIHRFANGPVRLPDGVMEKVFQRLPREQIFAQTGIQFIQVNTLYQLFALALNHPQMLQAAQTYLMIPDLFNYWLCGRMACELTDAITTQFYNPGTHNWAFPILESLGLPAKIFPEIVPPGTILGRILPELARETGLGPLPVITVPSHDTAAAVAAVPGLEAHFGWISSGTWSILGAEVAAPVINAQAYAGNVTNEGGVSGSHEMMEGTLKELHSHRIVVWDKHGVMARSDISVKRAADRIEYAETGARYEYMNLVNHELGEGLSTEQIREICKAFNISQTIF